MIYLLIALIVILIIFLARELSKLRIEKLKNSELISNNQNYNDENEKFIEEISYLNELMDKMYQILKNVPSLNPEILDKFKRYKEKRPTLHMYKDFLKRFEEELERKRRYGVFKFSIMEISLDFYDEYLKLYGNKINEANSKLRNLIFKNLRKIDYLSKGKKDDRLYVLLPMTDLNGSTVVGKRIQDLVKKIGDSEKSIITLTISVCEVEEEIDIRNVITKLDLMRKESIESGGNIIKVEKI